MIERKDEHPSMTVWLRLPPGVAEIVHWEAFDQKISQDEYVLRIVCDALLDPNRKA